MGIYNELRAPMRCPSCHITDDTIINLYFGFRNLLDYRIGDTVTWVSRKIAKNGGRPEGGNMDGEAWFECKHCGACADLIVRVRTDVIKDVIVPEG